MTEQKKTPPPADRTRFYGGEGEALQREEIAEQARLEAIRHPAPAETDQERYLRAVAAAEEANMAPLRAAQEAGARQKEQLARWEEEAAAKRYAINEKIRARTLALVEFGLRLQELRAQARLSQTELGIFAGFTQETLSRIERGVWWQQPDSEDMARLLVAAELAAKMHPGTASLVVAEKKKATAPVKVQATG